QGHLILLQVHLRTHFLVQQRGVALDLPRFVPDLNTIGLHVFAVSLDGCLDEPVVPANEQVALFYQITNLHWNLENLCVELSSEVDSLSLLDCATAPDDFFKCLPADRHGLHWRRCMHGPSLAGSRVDHVENCIQDEKSQE